MGAFPAGFVTGLTLIVAIGAQNAFVLRQGLTGRHVLPLVLFCGASDAVLIAAGVAGFGRIVTAASWLPRAMAVAGAAFLLAYGALRFRAAWRGGGGLDPAGQAAGLWRTLGLAAGFTWLNPHVWLDTVALIGAISTRYAGPAAWAFGVGAMAASFAWFAGLGFGAAALRPVMARPGAWRVLDTGIGMTMWALAAMLLAG